jgi:hypothetical protein
LSDDTDWYSESDIKMLEEGVAAVCATAAAGLLPVQLKLPVMVDSPQANAQRMAGWLRDQRSLLSAASGKLSIERLEARFRSSLSGFSYEFTDAEFTGLQANLDELRNLLAPCTTLAPGYRQRALNRLDLMARDLRKRPSDLDRYWGLISEADVVRRKLGESGNTIVDRIRGIEEIVRQAQARAEDLPSEAPLSGTDNEAQKAEAGTVAPA